MWTGLIQYKGIVFNLISHKDHLAALFKKLCMQPNPAPTDYAIKRRQGIHPGVFFPSSENIRNAERVFYEYLGLAWAKLRGQI
jgi:hypothetical protein